VHNYMRANDIYEQIRRLLLAEGGPGDDADMVAHLQQKGVVDDVVRALRHNRAGAHVGSGAPPADAAAAATGPHIALRLRGGTAFSDALCFAGEADGDAPAFLQLHINFSGQRFVSAAVPFSDRPELTGLFRLALLNGSGGARSSADQLQLLRDTSLSHVQFCATRIDGATGAVSIVGTNVLEWRRVLVTGHFEGPIELFRFGGGSQSPVGVLSVRLELAPAIREGRGLSNEYLSEHLRTAYMVRSKAESDLEAYCRTWWQHFVGL
jgi:hypothetical protein